MQEGPASCPQQCGCDDGEGDDAGEPWADGVLEQEGLVGSHGLSVALTLLKRDVQTRRHPVQTKEPDRRRFHGVCGL